MEQEKNAVVGAAGEFWWPRSTDISDLATALAKAQGAFEPLKRTRQVEVTTRAGTKYLFKYAPLDEVLAVVKEPLSKNGLSLVQLMDTDATGIVRLKTILMHSSGQWIMSVSPIYAVGGGHQDFGGALTYQRRYAICALLGLAGEHDEDNNLAESMDFHEIEKGTKQDINDQAAKKPSSEPRTIGPVERVYALAAKIGVTPEEVDGYIMTRFGIPKDKLTTAQKMTLVHVMDKLPSRSAFIEERDQWADTEQGNAAS